MGCGDAAMASGRRDAQSTAATLDLAAPDTETWRTYPGRLDLPGFSWGIDVAPVGSLRLDADPAGDGRLDIAYVQMPHVLGRLRVLTLRTGESAEIATFDDMLTGGPCASLEDRNAKALVRASTRNLCPWRSEYAWSTRLWP